MLSSEIAFLFSIRFLKPIHIVVCVSSSFLTEELYDGYAAAAKLLQSCLTLCDPIDGSPPGSPVPGIFQARTLEWIAISFANA